MIGDKMNGQSNQLNKNLKDFFTIIFLFSLVIIVYIFKNDISYIPLENSNIPRIILLIKLSLIIKLIRVVNIDINNKLENVVIYDRNGNPRKNNKRFQ